MSAKSDKLYRLIVEIRRAFNDLKNYSDIANADIGITASMRAVLEYLAENGPTTVPDVARTKDVSRQHIQQLADALVGEGLCTWQENPRHKRSQFLAMTQAGARNFQEIRKREEKVLAGIAENFDAADLENAVATIGKLRGQL